MKWMSVLVASIVAAAALEAGSPARYVVSDLGPIGPSGSVVHISNLGVVSGASLAPDGSLHATLWWERLHVDLGRRGLGGANSIAFATNRFVHAVGGAETGEADSTGIDFCGFRAYGVQTSNIVCAPFLWRNGTMAALPTLGGRNGTASQINQWDVAAGETETADGDPDCPSRRQFKPAIWKGGQVHALTTYPGDPDGVGYAINDGGQVVGSSGTCAPFSAALQLAIHPLHPRLWQPDGTAVDLGSLGGTGYGLGNLAININNNGHVVGTSDIAGDAAAHAFLWTPETGMRDLGTLPGDVNSGAAGINDSDVVAGLSLAADFSPRAIVWQAGRIADLNALVAPTRLRLLLASSINNAGQITGIAIDTRTGEVHAYVATPVPSATRWPASSERQ